MFGIQTAIQGGSVPLLANSSKKRMKRIYEKQRAMPMPMWSHVPPRTLREESETPMSVRMNVPTG